MGETLSDLPAGVPGMFQRAAGLEVKLVGGALASIDDIALFAGGNAMALSDGSGLWEVLQFRDAELLGTDHWRLSHLLRGQAGTEGVMQPVWPAGSTLIVLDAAPRQISVPSAVRGVTRRYRVGPASRPVDHLSYVELTHAAGAVGLRPYAPAHLRSVADGAGGHALSWVRRTRIDGDRWDLADVPLGEAYEAYRVRVLDAGQVVREETVTAAAWTYDAATRAGDGVGLPFTVEVAQMSDLYGAGTNARIMIDA